MDSIKKLDKEEFNVIASQHPYPRDIFIKDYFLTLLLYLLKDVEGIYFKGGTALNKIFLNQPRLSEDIDFTLTRDIAEVKKEIKEIIGNTHLFENITRDKDVDGFLRIIAHYKDFDGNKNTVFIDLNQRGKIFMKPEDHAVKHFYHPFIPTFSVKTLAQEELIAEKVAASIGRNKPRDHFDVYQIIHAHIPINLELVKKKCHESGDEFSIIKMFNRAKKLKNRWDKDMIPLLSISIDFHTVIKFLAQHFKLKEGKDTLKTEKLQKENKHAQ